MLCSQGLNINVSEGWCSKVQSLTTLLFIFVRYMQPLITISCRLRILKINKK